MKNFWECSRKELLSLPIRKWDHARLNMNFDSILMLPTDKKHDSGWRCMAVIGINKDQLTLLSTCSDDINWHIPAPSYLGEISLRCDCCFKNRAMHYWLNGCVFEVGMPNSSIDIRVVRRVVKSSKE
jgi:hypothetical protein